MLKFRIDRCITAASSTLIDLVFTNSPNKIVSSGVLHSSLSDHYPVYMVRKISASFPRSHKYVTSRNYSKFDTLRFRNELSKLPWDTLNNYSDPESMWQAWKNMLLSVADQHAPVKTKRVRRTVSPWLTHEIKLLIIKRDRTKLSARNSNDAKLWSDYKSLRNQVNREIKNSKKCYYIAKFSKGRGNPKEMWKTINSIKGKSQKDSTIREITVDETDSINNREEITDFINNHFTNIGPQLASQLPNPTKTFNHFINATSSTFQLTHIKLSDVLNLL